MRDNIERRVFGFFILMLAILIYIAVVAVHNIQRSIKSEAWVNKTHDVIYHANQIVDYLRAGDAALSTFVVSGDGRDQAAYRAAYSTMLDRQDELKALARSGEEFLDVHRQALGLDPLIAHRIEISRSIARAREQGGLDGVRKIYLSGPDLESIEIVEHAV